MKLLFSIITTLLVSTASAQYAAPCTEIPALNSKIVALLKPWIGKTIARGECWDAAKLALNEANAEWGGLYNFGRVVDVKTECIQPGDIVQFEDVVVEVRDETGGFTETFPHHTAIVYSVNGPGDLELIHQNTGQFGRKMGVSALRLANIKKGKLTIYRPIPKTN